MMSRAWLVIAVASAGCAADSMEKYAVPANAELVESPRAIRLDVYPSGNLDLLPQSFTVLPNELEDVYLALSATVVVEGRVTGTLPSPVDITIPSEDAAPVEARVTLEIPDTVMRATVVSDADGTFQIEIPGGVGYRAVGVALSPAELPLFVEDYIAFSEDSTFDLDLGLGVPLSGVAIQDDGSPLPSGAQVYLVDEATGESGPSASISPSGEYLLRVLPGDYTLVLEGSSTSAVPRVPFPITIEDEDIFVRQDLIPGTITLGRVSGSVVDDNGRPVDDAEVRFDALELDGLPEDAIATVATDTDRNGLFAKELAQGRWTVEVIPRYEPSTTISPARFTIDVDQDSVALGALALGPRATLDAQVVIAGQPARNIVLTAQEQGFNQYSYTATSDEDGGIRLAVPNVPLDLTLQSPDADQPITRLETGAPEDIQRIELDSEGSLVAGILLDPDGLPLAYALVEIRDAQGALLGTTLTDDSGQFRLTVALLEDYELDTGDPEN